MYLRIASLLTLALAAPFAHAAGFPNGTYVSGEHALANATGVYAWKADGSGITFTKDKDGCSDRIQSLDGKTWKRKA